MDKKIAVSHRNKTSKGKLNSYATVINSGINKIPHRFGCFNILHHIRQEYLTYILAREKNKFLIPTNTDN